MTPIVLVTGSTPTLAGGGVVWVASTVDVMEAQPGIE